MKKAMPAKAVFLTFAFALLFSATPFLAPESFRVTKAHTLRLAYAGYGSETVNLGYNDGVALVLPDDLTFIKALEIEIKTPHSALQFPGGIAYGIYTNISPEPDGNTYDFTADRFLIEVLPSKLTFVFQIPLRENHGLKTDPYTVVVDPMAPQNEKEGNGSIFFRLFPIMKGMPEYIEEAVFPVKIKPVLTDEGGVRLYIKYHDTDNPGEFREDTAGIVPNVRLDESPVPFPEETQILPTGSHHLVVSAENYRTEVRVFTVEQAKITELTVEMKDTAPTVVFASPDNAEITFDGEKIENPRALRKIEPGKHLVVFSVGDYKLQKQFTAEEGRDYSVSMKVDAEITELE